MTTTVHMCIDVRGMLRWDRRETKRMLRNITRGDGAPYPSVDSFRDAMMDELAKGHEVLPLSKDCDGFDFKKGCPGHKNPPTDVTTPTT